MARRLTAIALVGIAGLSLSGCAIANAIAPPVEQAIYATPADAEGAPSAVKPPTWVPGEATLIRVKTNTSKRASIMTYTMPGPPTPIGQPCTAEEMTKTPRIDDTWWLPQAPTEGVNCLDGWHIWFNSPQVYAWKS